MEEIQIFDMYTGYSENFSINQYKLPVVQALRKI